LTTEERLSDIVEILAHGLLWLDAFSVDLCSHIGSCAALAHVASWPDPEVAASPDDFRYLGYSGLVVLTASLSKFDPTRKF